MSIEPVQITQQPPIGQRLLLRRKDGQYVEGELKENRAVDRDGDRLGAPLQLTSSWCSFEREAFEWALMPLPLTDARWKPGKPPVRRFKGDQGDELYGGEEIITYGRVRDRPDLFWVTLQTATADPLPFPGFAGGPMVRYEGTLGWMRASEAMSPFYMMPIEILTGEAWLDAERRVKAVYEAELAYAVSLGVICDAALYNREFVPLMNGRIQEHHRFKVRLTDFTNPKKDDPVDRRALLVGWCADIVRTWMRANPNLWDGAGLSHHEIYMNVATLAAYGVLDHYGRSMTEWMTEQLEAAHA